MASIDLRVSIYPTVWCVVMADAGLPVGEVVDSIWATKHLAEAKAFQMGQKDPSVKWEVASTPVGIGLED